MLRNRYLRWIKPCIERRVKNLRRLMRFAMVTKHTASQHNALRNGVPSGFFPTSAPSSMNTSRRTLRVFVVFDTKYLSSVAQKQEETFFILSVCPKVQTNELNVVYDCWLCGTSNLEQNISISSTRVKRTCGWRNNFCVPGDCRCGPMGRLDPVTGHVKGLPTLGHVKGLPTLGSFGRQDSKPTLRSFLSFLISSNNNVYCKYFDISRWVSGCRRCRTRAEARRMFCLCDASDDWVQVTPKAPALRSCIIQCWWVSAILECDKIPKPPMVWSSSVSSVSVPQGGTPVCGLLLFFHSLTQWVFVQSLHETNENNARGVTQSSHSMNQNVTKSGMKSLHEKDAALLIF